MRRLLVALLLPAIVLSTIGCQNKPKTTAGDALATAGRKTMSRADFEKAVEGKTPAEVAQVLGVADKKIAAGQNEEWVYAAITTNGAKTDLAAHVFFERGKVVRFTYSE
jgi:hypothetical protein